MFSTICADLGWVGQKMSKKCADVILGWSPSRMCVHCSVRLTTQKSEYRLLPFFATIAQWKTKQKNITGGPPLRQKSLTRFPLTQFLVYVRASGGFSGSKGP